MSAQTIRLYKEARAMLWPWCIVMLIGSVRLAFQALGTRSLGLWGPFDPNYTGMGLAGFYLGIPLLATLPFGNEFQYRTLPGLLSQPVTRMQIWAEKMMVTVIAVSSAAAVYYFGWHAALQQEPALRFAFSLFFIAAVCSAACWTLIAKSTIGGLMLNLIVQGFVLVPGLNLNAIRDLRHAAKGELLSLPMRTFLVLSAWISAALGSLPHKAEVVLSVLVLFMAGIMLWLGARKLARFQVTGITVGDDLLTTLPNPMPQAFTAAFRCRTNQPILNLIRKELRLLRPFWVLTLLAIVAQICLAPQFVARVLISVDTVRDPAAVAEMAGVLFIMYLWLATTLAGSLLVGEERTLETQVAQMTLPISVRQQWFTKLMVSILASFVGSASVFFVARFFESWGSPQNAPVLHEVVAISLASIAAFWASCAVNGTIPAAIVVYPALGVFSLAGQLGFWLTSRLSNAVDIMGFIVSRFHAYPFTLARHRFGPPIAGLTHFTNVVVPFRQGGGFSFDVLPDVVAITWLVAPAVITAVIQSYRLFRTERRNSLPFVVRSLLPVALAAFLSAASLRTFLDFSDRTMVQTAIVLRETHEGVQKLNIDAARLDAAHPMQISIDDLSKVSSISDLTRRWLAGAQITATPNQANPYWRKAYTDASNYFTTIHLSANWDCTAYSNIRWDCRSPDGGHYGDTVVP